MARHNACLSPCCLLKMHECEWHAQLCAGMRYWAGICAQGWQSCSLWQRTACVSLDHSLICNKVHLMSLIPPFNFSFFFWCPFFSELCLINPRLQGIDSSDGWMDGWIAWKRMQKRYLNWKILQDFVFDVLLQVSSFHCYFRKKEEEESIKCAVRQCMSSIWPGTCVDVPCSCSWPMWYSPPFFFTLFPFIYFLKNIDVC
jgi:hypothetical protein